MKCLSLKFVKNENTRIEDNKNDARRSKERSLNWVLNNLLHLHVEVAGLIPANYSLNEQLPFEWSKKNEKKKTEDIIFQ